MVRIHPQFHYGPTPVWLWLQCTNASTNQVNWMLVSTRSWARVWSLPRVSWGFLDVCAMSCWIMWAETWSHQPKASEGIHKTHLEKYLHVNIGLKKKKKHQKNHLVSMRFNFWLMLCNETLSEKGILNYVYPLVNRCWPTVLFHESVSFQPPCTVIWRVYLRWKISLPVSNA